MRLIEGFRKRLRIVCAATRPGSGQSFKTLLIKDLYNTSFKAYLTGAPAIDVCNPNVTASS